MARIGFGFQPTADSQADERLRRLQVSIGNAFKKVETWASGIDDALRAGSTEIVGASGTTADVDATTGALRVSLRPTDPGSYGHYKLAAFSGLTTGLAANAPVFSFRWGDTTRKCSIERIRVVASVAVGFTAAQEIAFSATIARLFSASDTGGTAVTPSRVRATYPTSLVTDARIATTVALTAGTRTLDSGSILVATGQATAGAAGGWLDAELSDPHPIELSTNEGVVISNAVALGAGGTVRWSAELCWTEVAAF